MSCSTMSRVRPWRHAADQLDRVFGFGAAHAGGRLVEQDDPGVAGDGDPDLERTLLRVGEDTGGDVAA